MVPERYNGSRSSASQRVTAVSFDSEIVTSLIVRLNEL